MSELNEKLLQVMYFNGQLTLFDIVQAFISLPKTRSLLFQPNCLRADDVFKTYT